MNSARLCFSAVLLLFTLPFAGAQARSAASKSMDISGFGTYQIAKPDFGPYTNYGGTVGVNVTRYFVRLPWFAPSLEVRGNYSTGQSVTEKSLVGGLRAQKDFHRYHPYLDVLGGGGTVKFASNLAPQFTEDRGFVLSYGGGVDVDLLYHFQLKLDVQGQHFNFGFKDSSNPNGGNFEFSPAVYGFGLAYRVPFRKWNKAE